MTNLCANITIELDHLSNNRPLSLALLHKVNIYTTFTRFICNKKKANKEGERYLNEYNLRFKLSKIEWREQNTRGTTIDR